MSDVGTKDRLCKLYHVVLTTNAVGEQVQSWPTAYASLWAQKRDAQLSRRGEKLVIADQTTQLQMTQFNIRWRSDVKATDRLTDENGLSYEITQMAEVGRRDDLILLCKAIQP